MEATCSPNLRSVVRTGSERAPSGSSKRTRRTWTPPEGHEGRRNGNDATVSNSIELPVDTERNRKQARDSSRMDAIGTPEGPGKELDGRRKTDRFAGFALSPLLSDVVFVAKGKKEEDIELPAHRVVLCAQSSVFRAMFLGDLREREPQARVPVDCPAEIWCQALQCCYGRKISIDGQSFVQLLQAADKYDLQCLKYECEAFVNITLLESEMQEKHHSGAFMDAGIDLKPDAEVLLHVLEAAVLFNAKAIESRCLEVICKHAARVIRSDAFMSVSKDALLRILGMNLLVGIEEVDLFEKTLQWGRVNHGKMADHGEQATLSSLLEEPLSLIRYHSMTPKDLFEVVCPSGFVDKEVILQACRHCWQREALEQHGLDASGSFSSRGMTASHTGRRNPQSPVERPGIHMKVDASSLFGWTLYYRAKYSEETSLAQLSPPTQASRVLMAARRVSSPNVLEVCACCPSDVFGRPTLELDEPGLHVHLLGQKNNGAYWYCVPEYSVGFADSPEVSLNAADIIPGEKRVSWHLGEDSGGGYRCGNNIGLLASPASQGGEGDEWEKLLYWS